MLNQVALMGRLTRDRSSNIHRPISRSRLSNWRSTEITRATNAVDFIACVAWDRTAEMVSRYYRKGERDGRQWAHTDSQLGG